MTDQPETDHARLHLFWFGRLREAYTGDAPKTVIHEAMLGVWVVGFAGESGVGKAIKELRALADMLEQDQRRRWCGDGPAPELVD